jgi:hypothetical protein
MTQDKPMQPPTPAIAEGEGRPRNTLRLVMSAIRNGWTIDPLIKQAIVGRASRILANPDAKPRDVARASATLLAIERLTLDAAKEEDRIGRLDAGTATENVGLVDLPETALKAVADTIRARRCPAKPRKR